MAISSNIEGGAEMERLLKELGPKTANRVGDQALRAGAKVVVEEAKARVAVHSGEMKDHIGARKERTRNPDQRSINIGVRRPVSRRMHLLEFGWAKAAAKPFMRPAFEAKVRPALDAIRKVTARGLRREAEKMAKK